MDDFHRRARGRGPAMTGSRFLPRAAALLGLAVACALVSNAIAGPERHLLWIGSYEASERASARSVVATPAASAPAATGASAPGTASGSASGQLAVPSGSAAARAFPPHPEKPWVEISGDDVLALHERGDVPFLDARRTSVYREGHIAGARPFSIWESDIDEKIKTFFNEGHDTSQPIVVYCSGGECEDSHMLATKLHMAGFDNALVYKDGFPDWQKRGLPVHTGDTP